MFGKIPSISARSVSFGILLALFLPGHHSADDLRRDPFFPAYLQRGDEVETRFRDYTEQLAGFRERLAAALKRTAPELLADIAPHDPVSSGYQILPEIITDLPAKQRQSTPAVAYSWPWTKKLISREAAAIFRAEASLEKLAAVSPPSRAAALAQLVQGYRKQSAQHGVIAAHIRYNRLWQSAIAQDRSGYDRQTALHKLVLERQRIGDRLHRIRATFERASPSFHRAGDAIRLSEIARDLKSRESLLARRIDQAMGDIQTPGFITMELSGAERIFRVPLFTDIEDREFVARFKRIIESTWRITDGQTTCRVELEILHLTPEQLSAYGAPARGAKLDVADHLARFPGRGAVLTTGGMITHVRDFAIVLGPGPVSPRVLAHEFGHVLGFRDRYVRGYRNLGRNGFQVMEIVADAVDIMGATQDGAVLASHFSRLIEHYDRKLPRQAEAAAVTPKPSALTPS